MRQLDLLTIGRQPTPRETRIASKTIKAYVRENLRGFAGRQKERERRRLESQARESPRKAPGPKSIANTMRIITVTYRASFRQPIGALNPLHCKLPGPCPVEVFKAGSKWTAREVSTPRQQVYAKLPTAANAESACMLVGQHFEEQLEPWELWGVVPADPFTQRQTEHRVLVRGVDICDLGDDKWGLYTPDDFTHIVNAADIKPGVKAPPAACGARVDAKKFVSTRARIEPTCPRCAEIYREEYAKK